jgi:glutathionylspermidine synthase
VGDILIDLWGAVASSVLEVLVLIILGLLADLANKARAKSKLAYVSEFVTFLEDIVRNAVVQTNQTYVEAIKEARKDGKLTDNEAALAFRETKRTALRILGESGVVTARKLLGDFDRWLEAAIEAKVNENKIWPPVKD